MWCIFRRWTSISGRGWPVHFPAPFPIRDRSGFASVQFFGLTYKQLHYFTREVWMVADFSAVLCSYATCFGELGLSEIFIVPVSSLRFQTTLRFIWPFESNYACCGSPEHASLPYKIHWTYTSAVSSVCLFTLARAPMHPVPGFPNSGSAVSRSPVQPFLLFSLHAFPATGHDYAQTSILLLFELETRKGCECSPIRVIARVT